MILQPISTVNSFFIPRVFESILPTESILPKPKPTVYVSSPLKPILANCVDTTERFQASINEPIFDTEFNSDLQKADEDHCKIFEGKRSTKDLNLNENNVSNFQKEPTLEKQITASATYKIVDVDIIEHEHKDDTITEKVFQKSANQTIKESNVSYNDAEAELLRTGEMIDLALNASEALELLDMGYWGKGMEILKSIAGCNHGESNFNLGVIFERGLYGNRASIKKAIHYYLEAAKLNYPASFYNLGLIYEQSKFKVEQQQAKKLFEKAAELGLVEAKKKLGHSLNLKKNVEEHNHDKCRMCKDIGWTEAEGNKISIPPSHPETCYTLARAYHFGTSGMPVDKKYALELYKEAAINGHKRSKRAYKELKISLATNPLRNEKTKKFSGRILVGKVKKRTKQKTPYRFPKEHFLESNLKDTSLQSNSRTNPSSSGVEFDSNAKTQYLKNNLYNYKTEKHSMTAF